MSMGVTSIATDSEKRHHFQIISFMMKSGIKVGATSVALATAARIYHKFFTHNSTEDVDAYLVATSALYLSGKVEEENFRLRDVINVSYRTMYPDKSPLDIGSTYWALREAVTQCELLLLRALKFHVSFVHPHKYLLHYIKSLYDWMHPNIVHKFPIGRTAWAILRDSYHGSLCLRYDPEHIAVAALYLAMHSYGIEVPSSQDAEYQWWEALVEDLRIERIRRICKEMMDVYEIENGMEQSLKESVAELKTNEVPQTNNLQEPTKSDKSDNSNSKESSLDSKSKVEKIPDVPISVDTTPSISISSLPLPPPPADEDPDDIYNYLYSEDLKS